jgi:hypothetical protein
MDAVRVKSTVDTVAPLLATSATAKPSRAADLATG